MIRTNRGRVAVYRQFWGWPLRGPRNLTIAIVAVAVLAAGVGWLGAGEEDGPPGPRRLLDSSGAIAATTEPEPGAGTYAVLGNEGLTHSGSPEKAAATSDVDGSERVSGTELGGQREVDTFKRAGDSRPASPGQHSPHSAAAKAQQSGGLGAVAPAATPKPPSTGRDLGRPATEACAAVLLLAVPGSYETDAAADPQRSRGMLARVTDPLEESYGPRQLEVRYVAYPASRLRPVLYPESQRRGVAATSIALASYARNCPSSSFVLVGFSQGAHVAGDVAAQVGGGVGPVPAERVIGVGLLSDPRRPPSGAAPTLPAGVPGQGILPPRPGGFGALLPDRIVEICAPGDPICDNSEGSRPEVIAEGMRSGAHRSYPSLVVDPGNGATATEWLTQAGRVAIDGVLAQQGPRPTSHGPR